VPAAELSGLIVPMGAWVLRRSLETAATWPQGTAVSVNVSARQLADRGLPALVLGMLGELHMAPARLVLEITETAVMADPEGSVRRLDALHREGVRVAVDDFGTGYTSLEHVQRLPVDLLKIDRAFTTTSATPRGFDMLAALLQIGRALDVETIAEGVETEAQLAAATALGATHVQGYLIGRPAPDDLGVPTRDVPEPRRPHVLACETAVSGRRRHDEG
jgi:EAL domain-containing protein (putative c-di-GMP-specific phosphodiesterase class I)